MSDPENENDTGSPCAQSGTRDQSSLAGFTSGLTMESIIEKTSELEHLNELVLLHLDKQGGFTTPAAYFTTVDPILDMLEIELRVRCSTSMDMQQVKLIIQDWIDSEIRELRLAA